MKWCLQEGRAPVRRIWSAGKQEPREAWCCLLLVGYNYTQYACQAFIGQLISSRFSSGRVIGIAGGIQGRTKQMRVISGTPRV